MSPSTESAVESDPILVLLRVTDPDVTMKSYMTLRAAWRVCVGIIDRRCSTDFGRRLAIAQRQSLRDEHTARGERIGDVFRRFDSHTFWTALAILLTLRLDEYNMAVQDGLIATLFRLHRDLFDRETRGCVSCAAFHDALGVFESRQSARRT